MKTRRLLVVLTATLFLTSCSSEQGQSPAADASASAVNGSAAQQAALADGVVTYDEYAAGYQRYFSCMSAGGFAPSSQTEENKIIKYSIPAAAVDSGLDTSCYEKEFGQLDDIWQVSQEDTGETAQIVRKCLTAENIEPESTLKAMLKQLDVAKIGMEECLAIYAQ